MTTAKPTARSQLPKGTDAGVPWALAPPKVKLRSHSPVFHLSPHPSSGPNSAVPTDSYDSKLPVGPSCPTQDQTRGCSHVSGRGIPPRPFGLAPHRTRSHNFLAFKAPLTSFTERNSSNGKTKCRSRKCAMRVVKSYSAILSRKRRVFAH